MSFTDINHFSISLSFSYWNITGINHSKCSPQKFSTIFQYITAVAAVNSATILSTHVMHFLPHDAMRKRGLCCHPVSVRPSVTLVDCIHTAVDIVKLLSRPSSPHHSSFLTPSSGTQIEVMTAYRRVYGFGRLRADCQVVGSAQEPYARFEYSKRA